MLTKKPPKNPTARWVWIKGQLELRGESFASIARDLEVTRPAVSKVKKFHYPRMECAIAQKLGLLPVDIWPERYAA